MVTVSYDEKPGIQAIANVGAQLSPVPGEYPDIGRDPEYKRLGTVSLLAGINLHDGKIYPLVRERHRNYDNIGGFIKGNFGDIALDKILACS